MASKDTRLNKSASWNFIFRDQSFYNSSRMTEAVLTIIAGGWIEHDSKTVTTAAKKGRHGISGEFCHPNRVQSLNRGRVLRGNFYIEVTATPWPAAGLFPDERQTTGKQSIIFWGCFLMAKPTSHEPVIWRVFVYFLQIMTTVQITGFHLLGLCWKKMFF